MARRVTYGYEMRHGTVLKQPYTSKVVFDIYSRYNAHISQKKISKQLTEQGVKTPTGKAVWSPAMVRAILINKKYLGDEFHPPIITQEIFEKAQLIRDDRNKSIKQCMTKKKISNCYSGKIVCDICGSKYSKRRILPHNTRGIPTSNWVCNNHLKNRLNCSSDLIKEDVLDQNFIRLINMIKLDPTIIMVYDKKEEKTNFNINKCNVLLNKATDQEEYENLLLQRAQEIYIISEHHNKQYLSKKIQNIIDNMNETVNFDEDVFEMIIKSITIDSVSTTYELINGAKVEIPIERSA